MSQKFLLGGVVAAFAAMAFALVLVSGAGTASAAVDGLSANTTTVNASGTVVLTVDADEDISTAAAPTAGDVRLLATAGDFTSALCDSSTIAAAAPVACTILGGVVLEAGADNDQDFTVDDDTAPPAGDATNATGVDTIIVTWVAPATGPASVALTAIQGTSAKSVTVTVRGSADTVELSALAAAPASGSTCPGTVANVINSATATAANGGLAAAALCTIVKDSSGTRLPTQAVIYSTTDGSIGGAGLVDTTSGTGGSAVASTLVAGTTGNNGDTATVTASSSGKSATVEVAFGGDPATCTITADPATVQTGASSKLTLNVNDSSGGPVADGIFVNVVQVNPGQGANAAIIGAPAPLTNGEGSVNVIAAIPGAIALGGTAPVSALGLGIAGASPTITCTASVQATGTVAPPSGGTSGTGGFTGTAPAAGSIGLLVTSEASDAAGLIAALGTAGCTVESLAVLEAGTWKVYINGAPDVVNAAFPASLAATTPFFTRCA